MVLNIQRIFKNKYEGNTFWAMAKYWVAERKSPDLDFGRSLPSVPLRSQLASESDVRKSEKQAAAVD